MTFEYHPAGVYQPDFWTIGAHDMKYRSRIGTSGASTNTAWIANLGTFVPFTINMPITVNGWWVLNGTLTTAHNIAFGVYREDFTKIAAENFTGVTTASAVVTYDAANFDVPVGSYFMVMADDSTRNFQTSADVAGIYQSEGCFQQSSLTISAMPSTATPEVFAQAFLPNFGLTAVQPSGIIA